MTIIPTIVSGIISILFWIHFRRSFKKHVIDVFAFQPKAILFFDILTFFSVFTRFILRFENYFGPGPFIPILVTASYVAMGFMGLCVLMLLLLDLNDLIHWIRNKFSHKQELITNNNRRDFLKKNLTFATIAGSTLATGIGFANSFDPKKKSIDIKLKNMHAGLNNLKIVQLSDIHIGPSLKSEFAQLLVDRVNAMKPDVIVITGDMIDGRVTDIGKDLLPFKNFQSTYGTYFVTGNHEFYWYSREWTDYAKSLGMQVLNNSHVRLNFKGTDFYLAGISDISSRKLDPENACDPLKACAGIPADAYSILLSHQPKTCFEASRLKYNLQLSGHTHGGQGFPWNMIVHLVQPYVKGLHDVDGMLLYVNSGTGFWGPPNRFMVDSEITELNFVI